MLQFYNVPILPVAKVRECPVSTDSGHARFIRAICRRAGLEPAGTSCPIALAALRLITNLWYSAHKRLGRRQWRSSDKGKPQAAGTAPQEDNYIAVIASPSRSHNQAAVVEARERRDTAVDLA